MSRIHHPFFNHINRLLLISVPPSYAPEAFTLTLLDIFTESSLLHCWLTFTEDFTFAPFLLSCPHKFTLTSLVLLLLIHIRLNVY